MTRLFLYFGNVSATFRIWQKEQGSQICVVPGAGFTQGLNIQGALQQTVVRIESMAGI